MLLVFKVMLLLHGRDSFSSKYLSSHELRVRGNGVKRPGFLLLSSSRDLLNRRITRINYSRHLHTNVHKAPC